MKKSIKNGFCPICGALIRDGECQSCGLTIQASEYENVQTHTTDEDDFYAIPSPEKKKKTGLMIGVIIVLVLFVLLIGVILVIGAYLVMNNTTSMKTDMEYLEEYSYEDFENSYDYLYEEETESDVEVEDYFEKYGNTIKEPEALEGTWDDIWDTIEE